MRELNTDDALACPLCGVEQAHRIGAKQRCEDCHVRWNLRDGLPVGVTWRDYPIENGV